MGSVRMLVAGWINQETTLKVTFKYRVVTEISSLEDAELLADGRQILFETNNYQTARRECIEWAAWDDIYVEVLRGGSAVKFKCDGALEADNRYPKTAAVITPIPIG